jgi:hypothetical protein
MRLQRRWAVAVAVMAALALTLAAAAGAQSYLYWWQQNMAPGERGADVHAHNHTYNELWFGPNAGWRSQVWEVTPAGYRHFDMSCVGNCFNAHPSTYYTYSYCTNRDGGTHFVRQCQDQW